MKKYDIDQELMIRTLPGKSHNFEVLTAVRILAHGLLNDYIVIGLDNDIQQFVQHKDLITLEQLKQLVINSNEK